MATQICPLQISPYEPTSMERGLLHEMQGSIRTATFIPHQWEASLSTKPLHLKQLLVFWSCAWMHNFCLEERNICWHLPPWDVRSLRWSQGIIAWSVHQQGRAGCVGRLTHSSLWMLSLASQCFYISCEHCQEKINFPIKKYFHFACHSNRIDKATEYTKPSQFDVLNVNVSIFRQFKLAFQYFQLLTLQAKLPMAYLDCIKSVDIITVLHHAIGTYRTHL